MTNFKKALKNINPAFKQGFLEGLASPLALFSGDYNEGEQTHVKRQNLSFPSDNIANSWRNVGSALGKATLKHKHFLDKKIAS